MEALWLFQQKNGPIPSAPAWLNAARVRTGRQRDGEITDFIYASRLAWQITSEDCSRYRGEGSHQGSSPLITHRAALAVTFPPCLLPSVECRSSIPKIFHSKDFQIEMCNATDLHLIWIFLLQIGEDVSHKLLFRWRINILYSYLKSLPYYFVFSFSPKHVFISIVTELPQGPSEVVGSLFVLVDYHLCFLDCKV